jgi:hypothetical protein
MANSTILLVAKPVDIWDISANILANRQLSIEQLGQKW